MPQGRKERPLEGCGGGEGGCLHFPPAEGKAFKPECGLERAGWPHCLLPGNGSRSRGGQMSGLHVVGPVLEDDQVWVLCVKRGL